MITLLAFRFACVDRQMQTSPNMTRRFQFNSLLRGRVHHVLTPSVLVLVVTYQAMLTTVFVFTGFSARGIPSQLEEKGKTTSSHPLMAQLHV